uniref:Secreted protein n=1 Tax=Bursaphelenchus xylophilus TaxID=6326 RepID=A0A1I7S6N2_BURXY
MRLTILFFLLVSVIFISNVSAKEVVGEEALLQFHKQLAKLTAEFSQLIKGKTNHGANKKVKKAKKDKKQKKSKSKKSKKEEKKSSKHAATTTRSEEE